MTAAERVTARAEAKAPRSVEELRRDFPALDQLVHRKPLVYLDSAATALKPQSVIDAVTQVYSRDCANIHRAVHLLSQRATLAFEEARQKARRFIGAGAREEVILTSGTTQAINLVARSWATPRLGPGKRVLISGLEHHSNLVPWQMACKATGATLDVVSIDDAGDVRLEELEAKLDPAAGGEVVLVAMNHVSNALGSVQPVEEVVRLAHARGAKVLLDGAQAAPHLPVDVRAIGCDFYAFSGHKLYAPTGVGVLYGRRELLEEADPFMGGGDMIRSVTLEETTYADLPARLEAGTPNIAGVIGLGAAIDYVEAIGRDVLHRREQELLAYGTEALGALSGVRIIGTAKRKVGVLSFVMEGAHPHDIGTIVDAEGVAIRTGHHCAQPVMERMAVPATARASLGLYNTRADLDAFIGALQKVQEMFG